MTTGTIFENTKWGLTVWYLAIYQLTQHKNGNSPLQIHRGLGVGYEAAWMIKH